MSIRSREYHRFLYVVDGRRTVHRERRGWKLSRCGAATGDQPPLSVRQVFRYYCRQCADSREGQFCPKCVSSGSCSRRKVGTPRTWRPAPPDRLRPLQLHLIPGLLL
jgi:hypothetical protein